MLRLGPLWVIDAPDSWLWDQTIDEDGLRIFTFGVDSPEPFSDPPMLLADGRTSTAVTPKLIRGISVGIALRQLALLQIDGSEKITRKGKSHMLGEGYRKEVETTSGKLVLHAFAFTASKLPGEPLPNSDTRFVMVFIAGKTDTEVEDFIKIFETLRPAKTANPASQSGDPPRKS
jgi:hypothetical protein